MDLQDKWDTQDALIESLKARIDAVREENLKLKAEK